MADRAKKKNLCRVIRTYAQHKLKGIPEEQIWEDIQKGSDMDYHPLFNEMREDTIKKVSKLLDANDYTKLIERTMRMTSTNWLMYDLIIVHEDVNVIGSTDAEEVPNALKILAFFVKKHGIEDKDADTVFDAWLNLYVDYNGDGRYCSPMLLQKRWYQIKTSTRTAFYSYWYNNHNNLKEAKKKPGALHIFVAKQFPSIITKPFVDWKKLYEKKMIMVLEQIDKVMGPNKHQVDTDADVLLVEPTIEVIDITDPEDKVLNEETDRLTTDNKEQEQSSTSDMNKASALIEDMNVTVIDHKMYSGADDDDDDDDDDEDVPNTPEIQTNISNTPEVEIDIEGTSCSQDVTNSTECNLNDQGESEHLSLETSKSTISVPGVTSTSTTNVIEASVTTQDTNKTIIDHEMDSGVNDNNDDVPNTPEVPKNFEKISSQEVADSTECNFNNQKDSEHLPLETLNSTISVSENNTAPDSNLDDDDVIEIFPESIKLEETMEIDGLCNVKIIDASHVDQDFQDSTKSYTDTSLSNHKETEDSVRFIDEESRNKDYSKEICMSHLEIVDDGIEFDEDDIMLPIDNETSSHSPIDFQESHDSITQEDSGGGIDTKLIMLPIVYTTKINNISILKDKSLANLDIKDIEFEIIRQSKPQLKQSVDLIKSECIDIDDMTEHETLKSISPVPDNLYYCKYIRRLLKVPRKRSYNPVSLCKNPDFNTRLRRLSAGFLSIVRNCKLLKTLKPLTIDLNKAFESELVDGTLYVPNGVDEIGTSSRVNIQNHTSSALLPTAMHVQSLIDNSQPFSEDLYSSGMIYKIPGKNKNKLTNDTEKEPNNITLLQYNSATTQVEKEISFDDSKEINTVVKQAPNISPINSSAVDNVLDNYLNNLNKNSIEQNIKDENELLAQFPENNSTNDTKELALDPSTISDYALNKQYKGRDEGPIKSNNDYLNNLHKKPINQNITDDQTIDDLMTSNYNELLAPIPESNSTNDTGILALEPSSVSNDALNEQYKGGNQDPIECINDNNQQNIISNNVECQLEGVAIASNVVITDNSTEKHDNQPMVTVHNNKKEKNKLKDTSKRLKTTNTPWYVHVPKKINYLEEDRLLTECSLKRMLIALNAIEPGKTIEQQIPQLNNKPKRSKPRPSRAKPKPKCANIGNFCCWTNMANSKPDCHDTDSDLHPCGTDFSKCTCCCKYTYEKRNSDKIDQATKRKEETSTSVNTLLTEYEADDVNGITTKTNTTVPKIKVRVRPNKTQPSSLPNNTENISASESVINITDCDSNITTNENIDNNIIHNIVGNYAIESNNGVISIDGSIINSTAMIEKTSPQVMLTNTENNQTICFDRSVLENTPSIDSINSNTNLFAIKSLATVISPLKLGDSKILLTTANFKDYVSSPNKSVTIENKEEAPVINYTDLNLKPSSNEEVNITYDCNVTGNSDVSLTPMIQEEQTSLVSNIVSDVNNSYLNDAAEITSNEKLEIESESSTKIIDDDTNEKQNEIGTTIECLPATTSNVENVKKSILSDLMEMAGISAADTTYDNAVIEPTQTAYETNSEPTLKLPTLSPVTTLGELKWALLNKAKFYSLNIKTGGLAAIAIEIVKRCNSTIVVSDDDDDDHNYVKKNKSKQNSRFYLKKTKILPVTSSATKQSIRPRILKRSLFKKAVSTKEPKIGVLDNDVIELDSSDDDKAEKYTITSKPKRYTVTKIIKPALNKKLRNASSENNDIEICSTTSPKEKIVIAKEIPEDNESVEVTLKTKKVRKSPMKERKKLESDESSDDEPLSKKAKKILTPMIYDQHLESEIAIDIIPTAAEEDNDFILGV